MDNVKVDGTDKVKGQGMTNGEAVANGSMKESTLDNEPGVEVDLIFNKKQKGTIDIWWLYDDGGTCNMM